MCEHSQNTVSGKQYEKLSVDAKLLYSLLLDRKTMAIMNGWVDQYGAAYVIYPKSEMKKQSAAKKAEKAVDKAVKKDKGQEL